MFLWNTLRGYYKAARRYEISHWVLKNISWVDCALLTREIIVKTRREISCLQAMNYKRFQFRCERCDFLCNHSNGHLFTCEDNTLFSRGKISCFLARDHLLFHWCLYNKTWYHWVVLVSEQARIPTIRIVQTLSCPNCPECIWHLSQLCVDLCWKRTRYEQNAATITWWEKRLLSEHV